MGGGYDARTLLIDTENPEAENIRNLKSISLNSGKETGFFKNIAYLLCGLYKREAEAHDEYAFHNLKNRLDEVKQTFNNIPFAYVFAKKIAGESKCPNKSLQEALSRDGEYLAKEIDILKPNIIVCCSSDSSIFNNVVKYYFNGTIPEPSDIWDYTHPMSDFKCKLYYYKKAGILLFNSFHPTRLGKQDWETYERVINPFGQFFAKYNTFDVVNSAKQL